jgi:glyoxylase-like metal-dependent hydrolase (beta-lactamase superfamily II)
MVKGALLNPMNAAVAIRPVVFEFLAPDVLGAENDLFLPGGIHFRGRMTVVRLPTGGLALISPNPIDEAMAAELEAYGRVEHLISPSLFHHLHLAGARERFPAARLYAPPGLETKAPSLSVDEVLGDPDHTPFGDALEHELIGGAPSAGEVCFFHRPSRTLIVADLVFNIHEYRGIGTGLLLRAVGAHKRLAPSRVWRKLARDRTRVRESLTRVLAWDFERVVVAHGRVVTEDAHAALERALEGLTKSG